MGPFAYGAGSHRSLKGILIYGDLIFIVGGRTKMRGILCDHDAAFTPFMPIFNYISYI